MDAGGITGGGWVVAATGIAEIPNRRASAEHHIHHQLKTAIN
jgi:hypothetical protein